jgi:hypothetical protein
MKTINKTACIIFLLCGSLFGEVFAQNLLTNGDFESWGGSLDGWNYTANTELRVDGNDHYAYLWGENGVLYQKVTGLSTGVPYLCTIHFRYFFSKQTTGYGFAVEKETPLTIPTFTIGATNLKSFCENNNGLWVTIPTDLTESNVRKSFTIILPEGATAVYICLGTKGAVAKYEVSEVTLSAPSQTEVNFLVNDKVTGTPVQGAEISLTGIPLPVITNSSGVASMNLISQTEPYSYTVTRDWYMRYESTVVATGTSVNVSVALDSIITVKDVVTRISKYGEKATPYPIFGHLWSSGMTYTPELITHIASSFDYIIGGNGVPTEPALVAQMKAIDPLFQVIRYQGGWSTNKAKAEQDRIKLQYYRCGLLQASINESATTFAIGVPPDNKGKGIIASEPGSFDTWIRIGDELMKILSVSSSTTYPITVTVDRGYGGTQPVSHASAAAVTAPLYTVPPVPGGNNTSLSYFTTVFDFRKTEIKDNALAFALNNASDGVWIDILVGWLSATSMVGGNYTLWDYRLNTTLSDTRIIEYTKDAVAEMYDNFYARAGYFPAIYGNNVLYGNSVLPSDRAYMMVETSQHPKVVDGFCHENSWGHMSDDPSNIDNDGEPVTSDNKVIILGTEGRYLEWYVNNTWISNNKAIALLAQNNLTNQPMTINAGFKNQWFADNLTDEIRYQFNKYSYVSYLLCVNVNTDSTITTRMGVSAQVRKSGTMTVDLEPFFYYPVGLPRQTFPSSQFTSYRVGSQDLYARKFSNGVVLINPFKTDMASAIPVSSLTGNDSLYYNPEAGPDAVVSVQLASRESMILIKSPDQPTVIRVPEISEKRLEIYPVPATDRVFIRIPGDQVTISAESREFRLYSSGRLVKIVKTHFSEGQAQIDLTGLTPGIYIVRLTGSRYAGKLIIRQ